MTRLRPSVVLQLACVGVLLTAAVAGVVAAPAPFRDGFAVDGAWVGDRSWTSVECPSPRRCEGVLATATERLLSRAPGTAIQDARFHGRPSVAADGSPIVVPSVETWNVVFTLADGRRLLETFSCHLGDLASGPEAYRPYCSRG